ncbi:MAG: hypothetical protein IT342_21345 [Candidatus Melainabacteria bacterium]|nr:hypothetical protein [Candidatus Melainabacteria bacterium]
MTLKYPNQRLAVYDQLVSEGSCISAIAQIAWACGLRCPQDLSQVRSEYESGACGSLHTARKILEETVPEFAEEIWQQLLAKVEQYKICRNKAHCRGINLQPSVIDCSRMAPAVMDLLLQLITEHSKNHNMDGIAGTK